MSAAGLGVLVISAGVAPRAIAPSAGAHATPTPVPPATNGSSRPQDVLVFPAHGTHTASPATEISFRGAAEDAIRPVTLEGSQSGLHSGVYAPHADGRGVSVLPDTPFQPGESVTVRANRPVGTGEDGTVTFSVARPAPTARPVEVDPAKPPQAKLQTFRTRPDLHPPVINVTTPASGTAPGLIVLTSKITNGEQGPMLLDDDGQVVWYLPTDVKSWQVDNLSVQQFRGQPVLTWWEGADPVGYGFGHYVIMDTAYQRVAEVQVANGYDGGDAHDFVLTPAGTALATIYYPVSWDLTGVGGASRAIVLDGIVQEIELATGRVRFEWHSLDHIGLAESVAGRPKSSENAWDYFHLNSIWKDDDGTYLVSARLTSTIYKLDGRTGEVLWRLGGKRSDFTLQKNAAFAFQHDARPRPNDQLSLFDNASADANAGVPARGLLLQLDPAAMTATLLQEYTHDPGIVATTQGNVQLLPNGNVFVGWGSAPDFSEFSADGTLRFNGRFSSGAHSYRAFRQPWSGRPTTAPDLVAEQADGGTTTVFVSWNGATAVATWRILAGSAPDQLQPVTEAPRAGFETTIAIQTSAPYLAAQALDDARHVENRRLDRGPTPIGHGVSRRGILGGRANSSLVTVADAVVNDPLLARLVHGRSVRVFSSDHRLHRPSTLRPGVNHLMTRLAPR